MLDGAISHTSEAFEIDPVRMTVTKTRQAWISQCRIMDFTTHSDTTGFHHCISLYD